MVLAANSSADAKAAYGRRVWGWGPVCGLGFWLVGFRILPWWAVIFFWWWPSVLFGAALGLAAVALAERLSRAPCLPGGAALDSDSTA